MSRSRASRLLPGLLLLALLGACADPPGEGRALDGGVASGDAAADAAPDDAPDDARPSDDAASPDDAPDDAPPDDAPPDDASPPACDDGARRCTARGLQTCTGGAWGQATPCGDEARCVEDACKPVICTPNEAACLDDDTLGICTFDGTLREPFPCAPGSRCAEGRCRFGCTPGAVTCAGATVQRCEDDGQTQTPLEVCDLERGLECADGACALSCNAVSAKGQYIGCAFWGVDTPNTFGVNNRFAFVVSNVDDTRTAQVEVRNRFGVQLARVQLPPRDVATLRMPQPRLMNVDSSGIFDSGFHITSDIPINAYQFNPLQRIEPDNPAPPPASNDASLLLPTSALGTDYIAAAYTSWGGYDAFINIVSAFDGNEVLVTPAAPTRAGVNLPPLQAGVTHRVTLDAGQILSLTTAQDGDDLTGTRIQSQLGVAVFGGVDCAQIPVDRMFCDHIEESIFPLNTWDTTYYAARFQPREGAADRFRVIASADGTLLSTAPSQADFPVLNRGESFEFLSAEDFQLTATAPVLLVQYMQGSTVTSDVDRGDPSMLTVIPARQFRRDYVLLVPDTYEEDYLNLVFPLGTIPHLNGEPIDISHSANIASTGFLALRIRVSDGRHTLTADAPFGVSVYGYDHNISYAYPGGLDLNAP